MGKAAEVRVAQLFNSMFRHFGEAGTGRVHQLREDTNMLGAQDEELSETLIVMLTRIGHLAGGGQGKYASILRAFTAMANMTTMYAEVEPNPLERRVLQQDAGVLLTFALTSLPCAANGHVRVEDGQPLYDAAERLLATQPDELVSGMMQDACNRVLVRVSVPVPAAQLRTKGNTTFDQMASTAQRALTSGLN